MNPQRLSLRLLLPLAVFALTLLWPLSADAQRRGRPGGGGGGGGRPPVVVQPVPARPVIVAPRARVGIGIGVRRAYPASFYRGWGYGFYDPSWMGWGFAGGPWYGQGWYGPGAWGGGWGPGWGGGWGGWGQPFGSARLQVRPRQAEVYIDGALAGLVDDFDGFFQRLQVEPGEHEVTIYLDGYRTESQRLLFRPNATLDVRLDMQPLQPGEYSGPRPSAMGRPSMPQMPDMPDMRRMPQMPPPPMPPQGGMGQPPFPMGPMGTRPAAPAAPDVNAAGFGSVSIRVQPSDARLVIDGEEWSVPEGTGPILVELPEGTHTIEVSASGRAPYRRTVDVRAGDTLTLNVSLSR
jgi:hypothetical protein